MRTAISTSSIRFAPKKFNDRCNHIETTLQRSLRHPEIDLGSITAIPVCNNKLELELELEIVAITRKLKATTLRSPPQIVAIAAGEKYTRLPSCVVV